MIFEKAVDDKIIHMVNIKEARSSSLLLQAVIRCYLNGQLTSTINVPPTFRRALRYYKRES